MIKCSLPRKTSSNSTVVKRQFKMATRWGIAGAGLISADFVTALEELKDHKVVAVAARSLERAQEFGKKYGVEKTYSSYEELSKDPDIDVVYVGVIHPHHLSVSSMMIRAGKPVLCEKPLCMNVKETKQLVDLAREKKVFLMEAVWSRYLPVYKEMMKRIKSGELGEIIQVIASFGQPIGHVDRITKKSLGGGSTLDIGIYCVQFASLVMGGEKPVKVVGGGHLNSEGIDETTSATLVYSNGRVATLMCSLRCALPCEGVVVGTKGTLKVNYPMWSSESLESPSGKFESLLPKGRTFNFVNSQGLMYEAMEVRECLKKGLLESSSMSLDETLILAEIMEAMRKQVGVSYSQDS
ncbi:trans-1,2-dihydrobenzene-1,2-diol dehydrogenase-like isoform X1 [Macrobrachium nipponense]|uniref:trans-1,2-dihydrobenzene-1,2-diol dehydrogenase-like isoform X1 n=1 Tax=Macrobrachium nipponense TaxID=159736 RepID=UPI0030C8C44F